jgi:sulfur-oxidizing protein SoxY
MRRFVFLTAFLASPALALDTPRTPLEDPYASGMWDYHQVHILGDPEKIRFDDRVVVKAPLAAEDSLAVPVTADATALGKVEQMVFFVDYGPIPKILTYWPQAADAKISFRFKIDQATPIRAAALTPDGVWHVGSSEIDAAGGGCTAPAAAYAHEDWEQHLGEVNGRVWPDTGHVRLIVDHPMDTGLADGIPVFIIETLHLSDADDAPLARLELHEPVSEDPAFTFYFSEGRLGETVSLKGRDNNGNRFSALLQADGGL